MISLFWLPRRLYNLLLSPCYSLLNDYQGLVGRDEGAMVKQYFLGTGNILAMLTALPHQFHDFVHRIRIRNLN